jgi:hypothetical protein
MCAGEAILTVIARTDDVTNCRRQWLVIAMWLHLHIDGRSDRLASPADLIEARNQHRNSPFQNKNALSGFNAMPVIPSAIATIG